MAFPMFWIVIFMAAFSQVEPNSSCSRTTVERWPSIVVVEILNGYPMRACAAVILRANYVLSNAWCFSGPYFAPKYRRIRAGVSYINHLVTIHYVDWALNHPTYTGGIRGDISVVKLLTPLTFTHTIQQGQIITQGTRVPNYLTVSSVGWRYNLGSNEHEEGLIQTELLTTSSEYSDTIHAVSTSIGGDLECLGYVGSPLYYKDPTQGDIVIGLLSSVEIVNNSVVGIYTAVSSYTNWIVGVAI